MTCSLELSALLPGTKAESVSKAVPGLGLVIVSHCDIRVGKLFL